MKYKKNDIVVYCPDRPPYKNVVIEYQIVDAVIEDGIQKYLVAWILTESMRQLEGGFGPDSVWQYDLVEENKIKSREDCKKCEYKLHRVLGVCPRISQR